jgi:hypothetical protein
VDSGLTLCPHCGGTTVVLPDPRFRWVCGACGGPRVPGAPGKNAALARARVAQAAAFGWGAGSIALAVTGALTSGMAALLWAASHGIGIGVAVLAALFLVFAWRASSRAGARRTEAAQAAKDGWREGARSIVLAHGRTMTATELAREMQTDEAEADELLTEIAANDEVRREIGDGDVRFRVRPLEKSTPEEAREAAEAEAEHELGVDKGRRG